MRLDRISSGRWTVLTGLLVLPVYLLTLAPDLTWANFGADGGELITAAVTTGVPHPPGYPLYVLAGRLFSYLPLGTVAYRFNLLSAVATAIAAAFVTAAATQLLTSLTISLPDKNTHFAAVAAGLAFAFAPLVWSQAVIAEVYALNLAFVAAFLWALLGRRPAGLAGFLLGLSITSHLTSLLLVPLALALTPRRRWLPLGVGLGLGLAPFLILPWLALSSSPVVWGEPATLHGWWWLVSGRLYHSNALGLPAAESGPRLRQWSWLLLHQFTLLGLPLLAAGLFSITGGWRNLKLPAFYLWRQAANFTPKSWQLASRLQQGTQNSMENRNSQPIVNSPPLPRSPAPLLWLPATAVLYAIYALGYNTEDAAVLLLPGLLLLSLLLACSLRWLGWIALLLPLASLLLNFNGQNLSDDRPVRSLAEQLLQTAPPDAILLAPGDPTIFTLWYFQHVEGQRPDLILVDRNLFAFDWYRQRLQRAHPELKGLGVDDLARFQYLNEQERPVCPVSLVEYEYRTRANNPCLEDSD